MHLEMFSKSDFFLVQYGTEVNFGSFLPCPLCTYSIVE
jgi:hypothetical protein